MILAALCNAYSAQLQGLQILYRYRYHRETAEDLVHPMGIPCLELQLFRLGRQEEGLQDRPPILKLAHLVLLVYRPA